ncbi:MAG: hypothetical protein ACP5LH_02635 [Candidatus Micrarchaeia archaeon]
MPQKKRKGSREKGYKKRMKYDNREADASNNKVDEFPNDYKNKDFKDIILNNILNNSNNDEVSIKALKLSSAILSMSPSLKKMQYENGFSTGKSLYNNIAKNNSAIFPEEMVMKLAEFFEKVGYDKVTTHFLYDGIEIHFDYIGNMNNDFEAGIIAGFLNALYKSTFYVKESFVNNTKIFKAIRSDYYNDKKLKNVDLEGAVKNIYNILETETNNDKNKKFLKSYWFLSRNIMLNKDLYDLIPDLGTHIGIMLAKILSEKHQKKRREHIEDVAEKIKILGLGNIKIINKKPLHIKVYYETYDNIGFINFASSIIDHTLSNFLNADIIDRQTVNNKRYIVDITEGTKIK